MPPGCDGSRCADRGDPYVGPHLSAGNLALAHRASLPLATRDLRVVRSSNIETIGLRGAAFVVLDELFSRASRTRSLLSSRAPAHIDVAEGNIHDRQAAPPTCACGR
jgi:hypothetical protein